MTGNEPVILIAEDSEYDVFMLCRMLAGIGAFVPVHVVRDGEEAIHYLEGSGKYTDRDEYPLPDLFLLDLKMPRRNGFDVLRWVGSQPSLSRLRIIVLTSSDDLYDIHEAYRLGASSYLVKPHLPGDLQNSLLATYEYWRINRTPSISRPSRSAIRTER